MIDNPAKKRLLFVITQGGPWGGAQRYISDLAQACQSQFEVAVAIGEISGDQSLQDRLKSSGVKVFPLQHLVRAISPLHDIQAIGEIKKLYRDWKPDIIHLNSSKAGILGALARIGTSKVVYTAHGWVFNEPLSLPIKKLYQWLESFTARWKDCVIVLSEEDKSVAQSILHIPEQKLSVIPLGIAQPEKTLSKTEARAMLLKLIPALPIDGQWIGTIANLFPTKGHATLIDALAKAKPVLPPNTVSIFIGDGPLRTTLEAHVKKNNLEQQVFFAGFVDNASAVLPAFDLFVLPSAKEGLPYTILEALHAGVPVIATDVGGVSSLLKNNSGTLVPPHDSIALGDAIANVFKTPATIKPSSSFPLAAMVEKTISLYSSLA